MADADRLVAALRYQQEMEDANRPVTVNPLMARKAEAIKQNAPAENMLTQYAETMPQNWQQFGQNMAQAYPTPATGASRDQILGAVTQAAVNAGPLMTVFHGSPHKFDKFDASKIGTGEGAQAYGHGLYFAENPAVAKEYSKMQPSSIVPPNRIFQGRELTPGTPEYHAGTLLERSTLPAARKEVAGWIAEGSPDPKVLDGWKKTLETLNSAKSKSDFKVGSNQNLYKVDLPDEHIAKMLDWDKPLSQQHPDVQKAVAQFKTANIPAEGLDMGGGGKIISNADGKVKPGSSSPWVLKSGNSLFDISQRDVERMLMSDKGEAAYTRMTAILGGQDKATAALQQAGIPGIRYLDGGSRAGGQGTSNFVVFPGNEGLLKILERM